METKSGTISGLDTFLNEHSGMKIQNSMRCPDSKRKCAHCSREFSNKDHYNRHIRSHTKEKPFRCKICGKYYPRQDTLLRHSKIHNLETKERHASTTHNLANVISHQHLSLSNASTIADSSQGPEERGMVTAMALAQLPDPYQTANIMSQSIDNIYKGSNMASFELQVSQEAPVASPSVSTIDSRRKSCNAGAFGHPDGAMDTSTACSDQELQSNVFSQLQVTDLDDSQTIDAAFDPLFGFDSAKWLIEYDFLNALDCPSPYSMSYETQNLDHDPKTALSYHHSAGESNAAPSIIDLRHMWYIQISTTDVELETGSGTTAPSHSAISLGNDVDDIYRANMTCQLRPPLRDEPLPSISFLNLCVRLFFTRFNVSLPLIHGPTFRPTADNIFLVLSICSAGALSMGSDMARTAGSMLFERINKAGLANPWERNLSRQPKRARNAIKAATIGQTFALLSGDPAHRVTAAAYHGSLISIARFHNLFNETPALDLADDLSAEDQDQAWRTWASNEEMRRVAWVLYIHDAEIAALFHHEPIFRHSICRPPTLSSTELFFAPTAAVWAVKYRANQRKAESQGHKRPQETASTLFNPGDNGLMSMTGPAVSPSQDSLRQRGMVDIYVTLSAIGASICECRHLGLLSFARITEFESDLTTWYAYAGDSYLAGKDQLKQPEYPFSLKPLWHYTFMALAVDLNTLELAIGKRGIHIAPSTRAYVRSWISSLDSKRCLLHALYLQNLIVSTSMESFIPIHTARIVFSAALCWYCYMQYLPSSSPSTGTWTPSLSDETFESLMILPEMNLLRNETNSNGLPSNSCNKTLTNLKRILAAKPDVMKADTLCVLESVLRRLATIGISQRFADLIHVFIHGEIEGDIMHIY